MAATMSPRAAFIALRNKKYRLAVATMKVLVLSSSYPYPVDIGRKVIISGFLEYLVSVFGSENVTFVYIASAADAAPDALLPCRTFALSLDGIWQRLLGVAWQSIICKRHALQEMMLYSRRAVTQLRQLMRATSPDLVIVDTVRMAQYLEASTPKPLRSILYLDDLYSLRYRRMLLAMHAHPETDLAPIGTFGRFLPAFMRRLIRGRTVQRRLLSLESQLLEKREEELPDRFDSVLLLNAEETAQLMAVSSANNILTVKPLLRAHHNRLPRQFTGEPTYLFLGNLGYPANASSLSLFLSQAMPNLVDAEPRTKLIVVGRGADARLKEQSGRWNGRVQLLDFVEDLAPLMATAAAMVVPLIYGSGLKMKVLDGLYYGVPIVSTPSGIDGVPAIHGRECFIADDIPAFVEPLLHLCDVDLNNHVSARAQQLYASEFAPDVVWSQYSEIFGSRQARTLVAHSGR